MDATASKNEATTAATVAEQLATRIAAVNPARLPAAMRAKCQDLAVDVVGLCLTARRADYVAATLAACDDDGPCTAIGHARTLSAAGAALVNGTAAHGEDFDDTFEGGPVHAGAVIVPAVLAACERHRPDRAMALAGIAAGVETMCRLGLVTPKLVHEAGFHPTAVFGAMAAAAGVAAALGLDPRGIVNALGIAGSMASGIIEYLAEGAWTKRMHAGWAAQSGLRAALMAQHGFIGPRTVFEGTHGLFHGFAHTANGDYEALIGDFGATWRAETLAFKPYPCGTMTHPYIDCARALAARGITAGDIAELVCEAGEGTVHRLWEPLADKQRPANGYAGKFSTPYCIAAGLVRGNVGLADFTDAAVNDAAVLAVAAKVRYVIDADNPYPRNFTGHVRAVLRDGSIAEERQPHLRGGAHEPLTSADVQEKFVLNARHGGWEGPENRIAAALACAMGLYDGPAPLDLAALRA
jgi:2-methylcitrate dehydratase PrpD